MTSLHFLHVLCFLPPSSTIAPILVGLLHLGHTSITLDNCIGASFSIIPPCAYVLLGFICFFIMLIFSIRTLPSALSTLSTLPFFPLCLPVITWTVSSFFILKLM